MEFRAKDRILSVLLWAMLLFLLYRTAGLLFKLFLPFLYGFSLSWLLRPLINGISRFSCAKKELLVGQRAAFSLSAACAWDLVDRFLYPAGTAAVFRFAAAADGTVSSAYGKNRQGPSSRFAFPNDRRGRCSFPDRRDPDAAFCKGAFCFQRMDRQSSFFFYRLFIYDPFFFFHFPGL